MLVVGLTGGIATGKSTVSRTLKKLDVPVVDADLIARQVVEPGKPAYDAIVQTFGDDLVLPNGELDRPKLGRRVFGDEVARGKLNRITHPAVQKAMLWQVLSYWVRGYRMCVLDVPLLFEGGLDRTCGTVVVVACDDEKQMQRLRARDAHLTEEDARNRVKSQMAMQSKRERADVVLENDGTIEQLEDKVRTFVDQNRPSVLLGTLEWLCPPFGIFMAALTLFTRRQRARARPKL